MNLCQTKIGVAILALACWQAAGQSDAIPNDPKAAPVSEGKAVAPGVLEIGRITNPRITESSGVVASRQFPGTFWTHNDGGGGRKQVLYAISRDGRSLGEFLVADAALVDWEDIAIDDKKHLYLADTGNNEAKRTEVLVHQIDEPDPKSPVGFIQVKRSWRLRFPGQPFDCESLFVWDGNGYVVSKVLNDARAQIFRFPLVEQKAPAVLELVATTRIESPVTGADISADGKLLALVAKSGAFLYRVNGDIARAAGKGKDKAYQTKFRHEHIEACCFTPEGLLATAESREIYLFTDLPFRGE